jgi:hypothetical protein
MPLLEASDAVCVRIADRAYSVADAWALLGLLIWSDLFPCVESAGTSKRTRMFLQRLAKLQLLQAVGSSSSSSSALGGLVTRLLSSSRVTQGEFYS